MILDYAVAVLLWLSIIVYASLGGADFGGGVWYFFIFGSSPGAQAERGLVSKAIGPVWEANNVWLIYLVVGLYTAFPLVAGALAITLFIPLSLALIGIVLRGAAFAFEAHIPQSFEVRGIYGRMFSAASTITPFLLGAIAAAVASGQIHVHNGAIPVAVISPWLTPFAIVIGLMGMALCATLAAVYLTVEAKKEKKEELADAFRVRAFIAGGITAVLGLVGLILAPRDAPIIWHGMLDHALWAVAVTMVIGLCTATALFLRRFKIARVLIVLETGALIGTWGLSQIPYIVPPDLTVTGAASPPTTMRDFFISALVGMFILIPSLWFLMHVFKVEERLPPVHEKQLEEA
ncbi:MAG TPA: cytochrome d ubiquinol oxidase subunit II [Ktedonobacteraceae bacterium]|nr:cytochrome d ubiquinol oxidase subunit II [Ktedonobacteraceae bacterium]